MSPEEVADDKRSIEMGKVLGVLTAAMHKVILWNMTFYIMILFSLKWALSGKFLDISWIFLDQSVLWRRFGRDGVGVIHVPVQHK